MEAGERRRGRWKAAAAGGVVMLAVAALCTFPTGATDSHVRHALFGIGMCMCGPFSPLLIHPASPFPFDAGIYASALWLVYFGAVASTRVGLVHWGAHFAILFMWNLIGLVFAAYAGIGV